MFAVLPKLKVLMADADFKVINGTNLDQALWISDEMQQNLAVNMIQWFLKDNINCFPRKPLLIIIKSRWFPAAGQPCWTRPTCRRWWTSARTRSSGWSTKMRRRCVIIVTTVIVTNWRKGTNISRLWWPSSDKWINGWSLVTNFCDIQRQKLSLCEVLCALC